jgi:hypothetical protein
VHYKVPFFLLSKSISASVKEIACVHMGKGLQQNSLFASVLIEQPLATDFAPHRYTHSLFTEAQNRGLVLIGEGFYEA